jgi:glycerophosphoryl diester phosphodiesterase
MSHFQRWPYARVLAHRGGGTLAPENTIAAIDVGREFGFRAVEFDVRLSRDGVPVVIHDATLERTTNGAGTVASHTAAQLACLDAGSWRAPRFAGASVPTLESVIGHCRTHDVWPNIEIKEVEGTEQHVGAVVARAVASLYVDAVHEGGHRAEHIEPRAPLLSSFSRAALVGAHRAAPDLPRAYLVDDVPADWREQLEALGCVSLHADHALLTRAQASAIKAAGYWLFCYTVNDPARAQEILGWGVDAFCTDRIDLIGPDFA